MPHAERQLRIRVGNRLEDHAKALAMALRIDPLPPLMAETVIVQSPGLRRWLTLAMATELGCSAGLATPFPSRFCLDLAARVTGHVLPPADEDARADGFSREALAWRLFARLGTGLAGPLFAPLAAYLGQGDQADAGRRRWQLAQRIADRFDEYQLYRGDLLLEWESGVQPDPRRQPHAAWQAALWRELASDSVTPHLARLLQQAIDRLETSEPVDLPPRVTAFALGAVPPIFLDLLRALARHRPVTIHVVTPTPEFWDDVRSEREQLREARRGPVSVEAEVGMPLLASLARQSRTLVRELLRIDETGQAWEDLGHADPGTGTALHVLQHDVLDLLDRRPGGTADPLPLTDEDASIRVHSCHSPQRELEVVRDQLCDAFAADPTLTPDQVLVLVTDLDRYAPFAVATLGARRGDGPGLPVRVADRGHAAEEPSARALLALLRLVDARLTAPQICDLLELDPVREAADLSRADLAIIRQWIGAVGIRWGASPVDRQQHDLPHFSGFSWREGLDRLIAGAASGDVGQMLGDLAPWAGDTTGSLDLIGRFARWFDRCSRMLIEARHARPLSSWSSDVPRWCDELLGDGEAAIAVRARVAATVELAASHAGDEPVPLAVLRDHLTDVLASESSAGGFLWGGITVAGLKPLRTIPARVIAVCGLDEALFPRRMTPPSFDMIAAEPRSGDRQVRDDDRQLLFETVMAARDRLILTYVGRSQVTDADLPPSTCLAEILDWCDRAFTRDAGTPRDRLVVRHPLQPFSPRLVDGRDDRLFTYGPVISGAAATAPAPFAAEPLPPADADDVIDWRDLSDAWSNPAQHFCRRALGMRLDRAAEGLAEQEPIALDTLAAFSLRRWLTEHLLNGLDPVLLRRQASARGFLPIGGLGDAAFASALTEAKTLAARIGRVTWAPPVVIDVPGRGWRLGGLLDQRTVDGQLLWRAGSLRPKDRITAWVAHLIAQRSGLPTQTRLVGREESVRFAPVSDADAVLHDLMEGFAAGLQRPLPLFPRAGYAFVERELNPKRNDPMDMAWKAYEGTSDRDEEQRDRDDAAIARCWQHTDPLHAHADEFIALARRLWVPLLSAQTEEP